MKFAELAQKDNGRVVDGSCPWLERYGGLAPGELTVADKVVVRSRRTEQKGGRVGPGKI